jgi:single-strand DNA-binding protein
MGLPLVATEFWIGTEPELRFTDSGLGVCKFRVKAVARIKDDTAESGWRDGKTLWATANVWDGKGANNQMAQHAAESLKLHDLVVISGRIYTREYTVGEGEAKQNRISVEIDVEEIGPSLRYRTTPHGAGSGRQQGNQNTTSNTQNREPEPAAATTTGQADNTPPF